MDKQSPDAVAVYVCGGRVHRLVADGEVEAFDHRAAEPYLWAIGHDVRPAAESLGAGGCADCHHPKAPLLFGQVAVLSPLQGTTRRLAMGAFSGLENGDGLSLTRRNIDSGDLITVNAELLRVSPLDFPPGQLTRCLDLNKLVHHPRVEHLHEPYDYGAVNRQKWMRPFPPVDIVQNCPICKRELNMEVPHGVKAETMQCLDNVRGGDAEWEFSEEGGRGNGHLILESIDFRKGSRRRSYRAARAGLQTGSAVDAKLMHESRFAVLDADRMCRAHPHACEATTAFLPVDRKSVR